MRPRPPSRCRPCDVRGRRHAAEQRLRQSAVRRELSHQQEQRDHDQIVIGKAGISQVLERVEQRVDVAAGQVHVSARADREHRDADRHSHHHQREHHAEDDEADADPPPYRRCAPRRERPPCSCRHWSNNARPPPPRGRRSRLGFAPSRSWGGPAALTIASRGGCARRRASERWPCRTRPPRAARSPAPSAPARARRASPGSPRFRRPP